MAHDRSDIPFHPGEQALQQRVGVRERLAEVGALMVRDHMPQQHRELFGKLPFVLVGSVGHEGQPHASLLAGPPGFVRAPDGHTLVIGAWPHAADPLAQALRVGASIGLLGIEPHTRRRNRMNGVVSALHDHRGFEVTVRQSFGNCPKYIQARQALWVGSGGAGDDRVVRGTRLDAAGLALVRDADTYFIASSVPPQQLGDRAAHGVDVSHRGGKPGFVQVERDAGGDTLRVPDFSGNNLFNTLGNLNVHPRAGLLFVDFENGTLMQLSVDSEIVWNGPAVDTFAGAQRVLRHRVRSMQRVEGGRALRWGPAQRSPFLQATGSWPATAFKTPAD